MQTFSNLNHFPQHSLQFARAAYEDSSSQLPSFAASAYPIRRGGLGASEERAREHSEHSHQEVQSLPFDKIPA